MKLYTEEQLRKTWNEGFRQGMSIDDENYEPVFFEDYLNSLTPIELPSDEEIEDIIKPFEFEYTKIGFRACAEWMRDKIQGGNK